MKKKLEADLMSIAHRVLQIKNKSDINQLYIETQKLYEKLAILRFVEDHFADAKPTIGQAEIVEKMEHYFEEIHVADPLIKMIQPAIVVEETAIEEVVIDEVPVEVPEKNERDAAVEVNSTDEVAEEKEVEAVVATAIEVNAIDEVPEEKEIQVVVATDIEEVVINEVTAKDSEEKVVVEIPVEEEIKTESYKDYGFLPAFELDVEVEEETPKKSEEVQISFMDLLGGDFSEPMFVKADQSDPIRSKTPFSFPKETSFKLDKEEIATSIDVNIKKIEPKTVSLNDKFAKGITIGLNDRIAFVKHLFGNSVEDYNRVMNQLITYDNYEEAQNFIEDMVKPDYNNWDGKEDYSQRFLEIIEKKFT
ncbi:hypothetical protein [Flavobacterium cellulosilyticum]|uniref:Uncharacterized protein n=1 Tax=Flavobacterium cellulosilyticum TaxID=2541731 RepID=A0A4R5C4J2_9FLAO|nr:hypothetical protein [Flavobacterium cellulosilyticum]TDD94538.1 hypothetical protein E0F76_16085 [Flavobacterium cellulosilyticum]